MRFYHENKRNGKAIPPHPGLSASPIKGSNLDSMEDLETTLDARCKTPLAHKGEILSQANRPTLVPVYFHGSSLSSVSRVQTSTVAKLSAILSGLRLEDDPDVQFFRSQRTEGAAYKLKRIQNTGKTFIRGQLQTFIKRSSSLGDTIGDWAAEFYATQIIKSFFDLSTPMIAISKSGNLPARGTSPVFSVLSTRQAKTSPRYLGIRYSLAGS